MSNPQTFLIHYMNKNIKRYTPYILIALWLPILGYLLGVLNRPIPQGDLTIDLNESILNKIPDSEKIKKGVGDVLPSRGQYFASINGTKYYPSSCSGSRRVKEENRIWFETESEAKEAGYEIAKGC